MNLKQIETFRWIARLGSFTAAAQRMNSTQSATSIRIQELEYGLGATLFDRSHRNTQLTAKGRELLPLADDLMEIVWRIRACAEEVEGLEGIVKIGVADLIGITWLPEYITTIRERFPKVDLDIEVGLAFDLCEKLCNSELDLVLAPPTIPKPGITFRPLGQVDFVWAAARSLKVARKVLAPPDIKDFPIITLSRSSYHYQSIEKWFKSGGVRCRRVIICNSIHTVLLLTQSGLGIGLLPAAALHDHPVYKGVGVLDTTPGMSPVEFSAMSVTEHDTPLVHALMSIAMEVSTFDMLAALQGEPRGAVSSDSSESVARSD